MTLLPSPFLAPSLLIRGRGTHMQVLQSYWVAPSATCTLLRLPRSYTDGSTCSIPLTVCLLLCHHMKSFLTLSNDHRASLCHRLLSSLRLFFHRCSTNVCYTECLLIHVSPLLCAIMFIGQISSTGIAGVESISQFSFGGCSRAYRSHLNSH